MDAALILFRAYVSYGMKKSFHKRNELFFFVQKQSFDEKKL